MHRSVTSVWLAMVLLPVLVAAQSVTLTSDHPSSYVVQRGDTLWDISARFLEEPWRWREIWRANPQIENPDLIYAGDKVALTFEAGQPVLQVVHEAQPTVGDVQSAMDDPKPTVEAPHPTVKLSPAVRVEEVDSGAIPTIPIDAIHQFLLRPVVVSETELEDSPYIVSLGAERLIAGSGTRVFARGVDTNQYVRFTVYRRGQEYQSYRDGALQTLGYEAIHIADAVLEEVGDPSTLLLINSKREVLIGGRLVPVREDEFDRSFMPRAPQAGLSGKIIAVVQGVSQIGQYMIVVLDLGTSDGIETGHVMSVFRAGDVIKDPLARAPDADLPVWPVGGTTSHIELDPEKQGGLDGFAEAAEDVVVDIQGKLIKFWEAATLKEHDYNNVTLPDVYSGTVMVFRPFERVSYALVMDASRPMNVLDTVVAP